MSKNMRPSRKDTFENSPCSTLCIKTLIGSRERPEKVLGLFSIVLPAKITDKWQLNEVIVSIVEKINMALTMKSRTMFLQNRNYDNNLVQTNQKQQMKDNAVQITMFKAATFLIKISKKQIPISQYLKRNKDSFA